METFESKYGTVQIEMNCENTCNLIHVETEDDTLGRAEIEQVMQEWANENDYGEVEAADEYEPHNWSARIEHKN